MCPNGPCNSSISPIFRLIEEYDNMEIKTHLHTNRETQIKISVQQQGRLRPVLLDPKLNPQKRKHSTVLGRKTDVSMKRDILPPSQKGRTGVYVSPG